MPGTFSADCDADRDLVIYRLGGFFEPSCFAAMNVARRAAHAQLRCAPNRHATLCDVSDCKIQAQGVLQMFAALINEQSSKARRLAFVTGTSLVRMQLRRLREMEPNRIAIFETVAEAEAWLFAPESYARAA